VGAARAGQPCTSDRGFCNTANIQIPPPRLNLCAAATALAAVRAQDAGQQPRCALGGGSCWGQRWMVAASL